MSYIELTKLKGAFPLFRITKQSKLTSLTVWTGEQDMEKVVYDEMHATCITVERLLTYAFNNFVDDTRHLMILVTSLSFSIFVSLFFFIRIIIA